MGNRHDDEKSRRRAHSRKVTLDCSETFGMHSPDAVAVEAIWCYALYMSDYEPRDGFRYMSRICAPHQLPGSNESSRYDGIVQDCEEFLFASCPTSQQEERLMASALSTGVDLMLEAYYSGVPVDMIVG